MASYKTTKLVINNLYINVKIKLNIDLIYIYWKTVRQLILPKRILNQLNVWYRRVYQQICVW